MAAFEQPSELEITTIKIKSDFPITWEFLLFKKFIETIPPKDKEEYLTQLFYRATTREGCKIFGSMDKFMEIIESPKSLLFIAMDTEKIDDESIGIIGLIWADTLGNSNEPLLNNIYKLEPEVPNNKYYLLYTHWSCAFTNGYKYYTTEAPSVESKEQHTKFKNLINHYTRLITENPQKEYSVGKFIKIRLLEWMMDKIKDINDITNVIVVGCEINDRQTKKNCAVRNNNYQLTSLKNAETNEEIPFLDDNFIYWLAIKGQPIYSFSNDPKLEFFLKKYLLYKQKYLNLKKLLSIK
jgi:hypothetical protein